MADDERLRRKNLTLLFVLLGLAVVLFCITIIKVTGPGFAAL